MSTVATLTLEIARAIALDEADLVVDLSDAEFIGAATVGVLVRTREFLQRRSRSLLLRFPTPPVHRLLELCGLADLLETHPTDPTQLTVDGGALASWVAVPPTAPPARGAPAPGPGPIASDRDVAHLGP